MPVRKITEQQFRTRRKDRRMVWVDLAALGVGLVVLAASVGGYVAYTPPEEPYAWEFSFAEGKVTEKWCYGHKSYFRVGCEAIETTKPQKEGDERSAVSDPITIANATDAVWTLTWTDDVPDTNNRDSPDYGRRYVYDNNSTDVMRLEVTTPWGETVVQEAANANNPSLPNGIIEIRFNISAAPPGGKYKAFDQQEVYDVLRAQHTVEDHQALGEWRAKVSMVRAGDQNGTLPGDACAPVPGQVLEPVPPDVQEQCYLHDQQDTAEGYGLGSAPEYQASYDDIGNSWLLDFTVRTYEAVVTM